MCHFVFARACDLHHSLFASSRARLSWHRSRRRAAGIFLFAARIFVADEVWLAWALLGAARGRCPDVFVCVGGQKNKNFVKKWGDRRLPFLCSVILFDNQFAGTSSMLAVVPSYVNLTL